MRVFKTKWFAREARSHAITDEELCRAILETEQGKADALGGGVFNRICRTSIVRNWLGFVKLQSIMPS